MKWFSLRKENIWILSKIKGNKIKFVCDSNDFREKFPFLQFKFLVTFLNVSTPKKKQTKIQKTYFLDTGK